jgi:hypothetical protein
MQRPYPKVRVTCVVLSDPSKKKVLSREDELRAIARELNLLESQPDPRSALELYFGPDLVGYRARKAMLDRTYR